MGYEIEFKLIEIKDINKIQRVEEVEDSSFGETVKVECKHDIADEYCKAVIQCAIGAANIECESRYIGCTDRIGHYEFEITKDDVKYAVILQQDTYEWNIQLTVQIGYKTPADKEKLQNEYDTFLEKLKLCIKNSMVGDWYKCVWITDTQSLWLAKEVYSEIYMAENELRAFVSKVMIENFGAEWYDKPEFSKMSASIELNANNVKRNVPNFANIDINLYTITLEGLMATVKSDIYSDSMASDAEVQKEIKRKIFSTTQLDRMQAALDFLRTKYTKKYNIWDKFFLPFIDEPAAFQKALTIFIANRNHVAHNKLLDLSAKNKMLSDTQKFREYVNNAVIQFDKENLSMEVEETLQAIEDQRKYEREAHLEIVESESGVRIRDKEEILEEFHEVIDNIFRGVYEKLYFSEIMDIDEESELQDIDDEQLLFKISHGQNILLAVYGIVNIDASEGATSSMKITVIGKDDENIAEEHIEYINGQAEYDAEQTCYMPVVRDSLDTGNIENISEDVENYLNRLIEEYETNGYSEGVRAEEDWKADAADALEEQ